VEQIRRLSVFADGYGLQQLDVSAIASQALQRQRELAKSGREQGKPDLANWAESAASWTLVKVTRRLAPFRNP
jgi:hypothetical protein